MFSFCSSTEYFEWLYAQPILKIGYVRKNYMDLARTLPYYVYIVVKNGNGKEEKIDTDIRLGDAAKGQTPEIGFYKNFKGLTVGEMKMETRKSMDPSQVAMLCTNNQAIYMAQRSDGEYYQNDNDPDQAGKGVVKEPEVPLVAKGTYSLKYLMDFLKLAKQNKVHEIKIELGRENRPARLEFVSGDSLNLERGSPKAEKTWFYLAPKIMNDDEEEPSKEKLLQSISFYEKEIEILRSKLPKIEEPKPL